ncbi:MAG: hypothetical protein LBS08_02975, partial [Candidatus Symbiothrix sp.]|jgi:pectin methylesterase-like acyl-CoA thioesterase|nr:hypothetical protein [Candidatus Symbiothrix sp.]
VIVRHLRFRIGTMIDPATGEPDASGKGSIGIENASNWIIDHCTFGWSGEENMTIYDNRNTTIQWCIIHEGLYQSGHDKGNRGYGMQWGGQNATFHHNLLAHNHNRTPRFNGARSNDINVLIDYVNNVNYNWGKANSCYGSDIEKTSNKTNFVNNYYKPGPARPGTSSSYFTQSSFASSQTTAKIALWYMNGNYMEGSANTAKNADNYLGLDAGAYVSKGIPATALRSETPFEITYPVTAETAEQAYESVLAGAGSFPRDAVDLRIVNEVRTGTASGSGAFGTGKGIIDNPDAVGGYPEYQTYNTVIDADHDGMDDAWETANGLNPSDAEDRNRLTMSGYTALEVYLNGLAGENINLIFDCDYVVAKDGSGDFTSLQAAIDASPDNELRRIYVKQGIYEEKILIGSHSKTSAKILSITGEDANNTIITWNDYNGKTIAYDGKTVTSGTPQSATFTVNATDFYAENLTIRNTYTEKQAVALYNVADRQVFKNCRIIGYQDTHYLKKGRRAYFYNCYIEGATDYICAGGTALFENCILHSLKNGSYITAPEDITIYRTENGRKYYYGFVFLNCRLTSEPGVDVYLGRPWQETASSVFLSCTMENIKPEGWSVWSGNNNHLTSFFAEYDSKNQDESAADVSQRVGWSYQLTPEEVSSYYKREDVFSHENFTTPFNPFPVETAIEKPFFTTNMYSGPIAGYDLYSLTGHIILRRSENSIPTSFPGIAQGLYILKIKGENGHIFSKKIQVK